MPVEGPQFPLFPKSKVEGEKIMIVRSYGAILATAILGAVALSACAEMDYGGEKKMAAASEIGPLATRDTAAGTVLVDASGMTLYTFDKDTENKSNCNGKCAEAWPPLMAPADAKAMGKLTVATRDDGSKQWAHEGKPLYLWMKDQKPGDTTGDNVKNVWHVVKQ